MRCSDSSGLALKQTTTRLKRATESSIEMLLSWLIPTKLEISTSQSNPRCVNDDFHNPRGCWGYKRRSRRCLLLADDVQEGIDRYSGASDTGLIS